MRENGGIFITFEGIEGSGKSTQIKRVAAFLADQGREVMITREPGGTPFGEKIRPLLLKTKEPIDSLTEYMLFCAGRRRHVIELIGPALERGALVLCDRFVDASTVYQGVAGGVPLELVQNVNNQIIGECVPDITFLFDLDVEAGFKRVEKRKKSKALDRMEKKSREFHEEVRRGYLDLAAKHSERFYVLSAERNQDDVFKDIARVLTRHLEKKS